MKCGSIQGDEDNIGSFGFGAVLILMAEEDANWLGRVNQFLIPLIDLYH